MAVIVTYNAPGKYFIAYPEADSTNQVTVTDAEVDERAEHEQRLAFERGEDEQQARAEQLGQEYHRREFEGFTAPSSQAVRERLASELALEKLGDEALWAKETRPGATRKSRSE